MDAALLGLLTDMVTLASFQGLDAYGTPTYGEATTVPARIEYTTRKLINAQGQEVLSRCRVFFDGTVTVTLRDLLTLDDGMRAAIQTVSRVRDDTGAIDHLEVWC